MEQVEVHSKSARSRSDKKSSLKASLEHDDTTDSDSQQGSDIEQLPMNEDIELSDHNLQDQ